MSICFQTCCQSQTQSILHILHIEHKEHIFYIEHKEHCIFYNVKSHTQHIAHRAQTPLHYTVKVRHRAYCTDSTKNIALCTKAKPPYRILHIEHKEHFTLHNVKVTHIEYCTYCPKNITFCTFSKSPYRILRTEHK